MPSTTTNYGWSYPISTDDLNAGATTIGTLATGIDTSLKAEANTRSAADSTFTSNIATINANKPNSNVPNIYYVSTSTTTNSSGYFTLPHPIVEIIANARVGGSAPAFIVPDSSVSTRAWVWTVNPLNYTFELAQSVTVSYWYLRSYT